MSTTSRLAWAGGVAVIAVTVISATQARTVKTESQDAAAQTSQTSVTRAKGKKLSQAIRPEDTVLIEKLLTPQPDAQPGTEAPPKIIRPEEAALVREVPQRAPRQEARPESTTELAVRSVELPAKVERPAPQTEPPAEPGQALAQAAKPEPAQGTATKDAKPEEAKAKAESPAPSVRPEDSAQLEKMLAPKKQASSTVRKRPAKPAARTYKPAQPAMAPMLAPESVAWQGFYLGGHLGGAFDSGDDTAPAGTRIDGRDDEVIGGIHAGYDWQSGAMVYGVEADASFGDDIDHLMSFRGRIGWAANQWLVYATAGIAFIDTDVRVVGPAGTTTFGVSETGFAVGGGVQYRVSPHMSAGLELVHHEFDSSRDAATGASSDPDVTVVRARLSWHL